jgi:hypothetical protein
LINSGFESLRTADPGRRAKKEGAADKRLNAPVEFLGNALLEQGQKLRLSPAHFKNGFGETRDDWSCRAAVSINPWQN